MFRAEELALQVRDTQLVVETHLDKLHFLVMVPLPDIQSPGNPLKVKPPVHHLADLHRELLAQVEVLQCTQTLVEVAEGIHRVAEAVLREMTDMIRQLLRDLVVLRGKPRRNQVDSARWVADMEAMALRLK